MSDKQIRKRLAARIEAANRKHAKAALAELAAGIAITIAVYGGIVFLISIAAGSGRYGDLPDSFMTIVWLIVLILLAVSTWSAWRGVDPFEGIGTLDSTKSGTLGSQLSQRRSERFRHELASQAEILLSGPANIFFAIVIWRKRIQAEDSTIASAAALLKLCQSRATIDDITDESAFELLRSLKLIRVIEVGTKPRLELTQRGQKTLPAR